MKKLFSDPSFKSIIDDIVKSIVNDAEKKGDNIYKNKVDPFSTVIDSMIQGITIDTWIGQEKARQSQKTLQNQIGNLHQRVIGTFFGWENLGTGNVVDVVNRQQKIVAEIKNKFNTTKDNHKVQVYRDLEKALNKPEYNDFVAYYVEIIPSGGKGKTVYNKPFTPSDNNESGKRTIERADIRKIDGVSFYEIVTGEADALKQLYLALPEIIRKNCSKKDCMPEKEKLFLELFEKAFGS